MKNTRIALLMCVAAGLLAGAVAEAAKAPKFVPGAYACIWGNGTQAQTKAKGFCFGCPVTGIDIDNRPDNNIAAPAGANGLPWIESNDSGVNAGGTNSYDAHASVNEPLAGAAGDDLVAVLTGKGLYWGANFRASRDGSGAFAIGDTAVHDSFRLRIVPTSGTSANVVLNGEIIIQRNVPAPGTGRLDVLVYPDSTSMILDQTSTGAGAKFVGRLMVDRNGIVKTEGWAPSDFAVQITADRVRVRATSLTKSLTGLANTTQLATELIADSSARSAVPGHTPIMIAVLSLLMAGAGWMALKSRRRLA